MTKLKDKKNIIFDLGNVVVDIDLNITVKRFLELGFKGGDDFLNKFKQSGIFHDFEVGKISEQDFIDGIRGQMNSEATDEVIIEAWNALLGDYREDRIKTIQKLKETHKVFILSNTNSLHINSIKDNVPFAGNLDNLFHKTYYSHEMNMCKPHANIFEEVLRDANIKAEETLFLDDGPANVEAARKLGIESWLVEYPDQWVPKMRKLITESN